MGLIALASIKSSTEMMYYIRIKEPCKTAIKHWQETSELQKLESK